MDIDGVVIAMDIEGAAAKSGKLSVGDFVMAIDDVSLHDKETAEIQRLCKSTDNKCTIWTMRSDEIESVFVFNGKQRRLGLDGELPLRDTGPTGGAIWAATGATVGGTVGEGLGDSQRSSCVIPWSKTFPVSNQHHWPSNEHGITASRPWVACKAPGLEEGCFVCITLPLQTTCPCLSICPLNLDFDLPESLRNPSCRFLKHPSTITRLRHFGRGS